MRISRVLLCLSICIAAAVSACDRQLAIEPVDTIDANSSLNTSQGVQVALTGAYDGLSMYGTFGGQFQYQAELLADDDEINFAGTFSSLNEMWIKTLVPANREVTLCWRDGYITINAANNVLSALDNVEMAERGRVEGEALFIRAATYFELVRIYAKAWGDGDNATNPGVPIVLTPTRSVSEQDYRPRSSVAEVYTRVITDLRRAEELLPENAPGTRASKFAAAAMLARVYLQQGNLAEARDAANRVIASGLYRLASEPLDAFREGSAAYESENVFRVAMNETDVNTISGRNQLNLFFGAPVAAGRGDIRIQQKHLSQYEQGDARRTMFLTSGTTIFTRKFGSTAIEQHTDVPVLRIAEMYLTRAECNKRLNTQVGATPTADVNRIRTRAKLPELTDASLEEILKERKIELAFEGQRLHDLKRTRGFITFNNTRFDWNSPRLVFPIPQREITTNSKLVQNPGYGN